MGTTQMHYWKQNQCAEIYFCLSFSIFSFFNLSLQGNKYGNFRQRFLRNYLTLGFWNLVQTSVWQVVLCIKESATYCLSVICPFFFWSLTKFSVTDFSAFIWARVFKFCIQDWDKQMQLLKTKPRCRDLFLPSFSFFSFFNLLTSKVINMEIFRQRFLRNYLT